MSGTDVALSAHYAMPGTDPYISIAFPLALLVPLAISSTDTAAYEAPNACPVLKCTILLPGARDYVDLWPRRRRRYASIYCVFLHLWRLPRFMALAVLFSAENSHCCCFRFP